MFRIRSYTLYMVYWSESNERRQTVARSQQFDNDAMAHAMQFMEALRARQRNGERVSFIAMASENPDSVGLSGVAEPSSTYNWKKRRP